MIKVWHYKRLTEAEVKEVNGPNGGWDSSPRLSRYSNITSGFNVNLALIAKALLEGEYYAVAVVDGDKDDAFELTNHITGDWRENDNVTALPGDYRSTSVGDIMEDTETGDLYVVAHVGFTKVA